MKWEIKVILPKLLRKKFRIINLKIEKRENYSKFRTMRKEFNYLF